MVGCLRFWLVVGCTLGCYLLNLVAGVCLWFGLFWCVLRVGFVIGWGCLLRVPWYFDFRLGVVILMCFVLSWVIWAYYFGLFEVLR